MKRQTAGRTHYVVNEVYRSVQGEGMRAGTWNVFVRFTGCNMRCAMEAGPKSPGGFDCDTEFESGTPMTLDDLIDWIKEEDQPHPCHWVILTGGEPGLQLDAALIDRLHAESYRIAIETNGSIELPDGIDWVTVSPKVAEHCIRQKTADEVKYVRGYGQAIPRTCVVADHYLLSPGFNGNTLDQRALDWCKQLTVSNPQWQVTVQMHKIQGIR